MSTPDGPASDRPSADGPTPGRPPADGPAPDSPTPHQPAPGRPTPDQSAPEPPAPGRSTGGDPREALRERIAADSLTTRRDYLRTVATVSGGLAVGSLGVASGILPRHGDPDDAEAPGPKRIAGQLLPGESLSFHYPDEGDRAVAVRLDDGALVGYSAICTHLACAVLWRKDRGAEDELYCPCHEGVFDARTGEVTAGPPSCGLPKVVLVEQTDGSIWAIGTTHSGESVEHGLCRQLDKDRPDLASRIGCPSVRGGGAEGPEAGTSRTRTAEATEPPGRRT
ncbi:Rieske 2Fe-2S domain-containing protein [Streptomyces sp. NPDC001732]